MKRIAGIFFFLCLFIILLFVLFGNAEQWIETRLQTTSSKAAFSLLSFAVLSSDIILPVPSSLVMILNGKVLGIVLGSLVSLAATQLSSMIGFYLGRKSSPLADRLFSTRDKQISNHLFDRFGNLAIVVSKSIPVISEAVSIMSGTTSLTYRQFFVYSVVGNAIISVVYAVSGVIAGTANSSLLTVVIIGIALLAGWIVYFFSARKRSAVS